MAHFNSKSSNSGQAQPQKGTQNNIVPVRVGGKKCFYFQVGNPRDKSLVQYLISSIATTGWQSAHVDTVRQLIQLLRKYDLNETLRFLKYLQFYGMMWEINGDISKDPVKAKGAYEKSSQNDWLCGKCKLGRCYAEGRGCQKDLDLAKQYLEAATVDCPEAEQFLDWYGLR